MAQLTRNQIIGAMASVFVLPSFILTVVPTLSRDPGIGTCMALGVIALPFFPFAIRQCRDAGARALVIALGFIVLGYNFTNALDALNRGHAVDTGVARDRITSAAALREKISELDARKNDVGRHKTVREAEVIDAQHAVNAECKTGHGPRCRTLTDALLAAQRDLAATERAEKIETQLDQAKADLAKLGDVEKSADPTATQLAQIVGLMWVSAASSGDAISTNRPIFKALVVEAMGGLMPWVMVTIFGTRAPAPLPKPKQRKAATKPPSKDSVLEWHKLRVGRREGRSVRAGDAFADYEEWCADNGLGSVNQHVFGRTLTNELGIQKARKDNRVSYIGIGLKLKAIKGGALKVAE